MTDVVEVVLIIELGQVQELVDNVVGLLHGLRAHLLEGVSLVLVVHGMGHPKQGLVLQHVAWSGVAG